MLLDAGPDAEGERLDQFLVKRFADTSRSEIQEWIRAGRVHVEGREECKASTRLRGGEVLEVNPAERAPLRAAPEAIDIAIVYEDDHLAVVDKAAGMNVHAGAGSTSGTLVNALLHHLTSLSGAPGNLRPGIVHRLDRYTTGLLVVAKHDAAHRRLQAQFQNRQVDKRYWAAVEGQLPADPHDDPKLLRHGRPVMRNGAWWLRIEMPIRRDKRNRVKMAVAPNGREAVSDVRRLRGSDRFALAEVRIHTGRTHQVRVHLASSGHAVVGDAIYGARKALPELPHLDRYLLHARSLEFEHPHSGARVRFEAPLPADFASCLSPLGL